MKVAFNRFAGVSLPSLVYVGIDKIGDFERIDAKAIDHREPDRAGNKKPMLSKTIKSEKVTVIFQHYIDETRE